MRNEPKPHELATRYLLQQWKQRHNSTPPLDLTESVVMVVNMTGYNKAKVDQMIVSYEKRVLQEADK